MLTMLLVRENCFCPGIEDKWCEELGALGGCNMFEVTRASLARDESARESFITEKMEETCKEFHSHLDNGTKFDIIGWH